jgi:hypothetical protein
MDVITYNRSQASENAKVWCPVCKQGELRDTHNLIYCTSCALRLDLGEDKVVIFTYLLVVFLYKLFLKKKTVENLMVLMWPIRSPWSSYGNDWVMRIWSILTEAAKQLPSFVYRKCLAWLHSTYSVKNAALWILWYKNLNGSDGRAVDHLYHIAKEGCQTLN